MKTKRPVRKPDLAELLDQKRTGEGASLAVLSLLSPVLTVFLRHAGCTFCREALSDIAQQRGQIEANGTRIVLVYHGDVTAAETLIRQNGLEGLDTIYDADLTLYEAFGLRKGGLRQLAGPKVAVRGFIAGAIRGHGIGAIGGDPAQMPGVFLLHRCSVVRAFRHGSAADRPDYTRLARFSETEPEPTSVQSDRNELH